MTVSVRAPWYFPNMLTSPIVPVWTSPVTVTLAAGTVKTEVTYRP